MCNTVYASTFTSMNAINLFIYFENLICLRCSCTVMRNKQPNEYYLNFFQSLNPEEVGLLAEGFSTTYEFLDFISGGAELK